MAFDVIAHSNVTPKPSELAQGIGTALVTTVVGLWIAIPVDRLLPHHPQSPDAADLGGRHGQRQPDEAIRHRAGAGQEELIASRRDLLVRRSVACVTRAARRSVSDPDMTPMIDCTFQLVIFFLLTLNFSSDEQSELIRLPASEIAKPAEGRAGDAHHRPDAGLGHGAVRRRPDGAGGAARSAAARAGSDQDRAGPRT